MDEKQFDNLIKRCLSGEASEEEVSSVEMWLNHRREKGPYNELSSVEKEEAGREIFKGLSARMLASGESVTKEYMMGRRTVFFRLAAAVMLLAVLTYAIVEFTSSSPLAEKAIVQSVSKGDGNKKIILSDSSIVWLKGNSQILYPEKFSGRERNVELIGEALFEVSKDPHHPFVIECGELTAKVLGTSFNIKSSATDIEVLVLTGKVVLSSKGSSKDLIVSKNEKAVYHSAQNRIAKVIAEEEEKVAKISGTEYSMRFNATRMKEIIRRIEGKFNVKVSLSDDELGNCTITADFTDQSLDRTLSMITQTLEIEYEMSGRRVILKGRGCH